MNKETRIKRTIGIIMLVFIIGLLTVGMFLPTRDYLNIKEHYFNETIIGNVNDKDLYEIHSKKSDVKVTDNWVFEGDDLKEYLTVKVDFKVSFFDTLTFIDDINDLPTIELNIKTGPKYTENFTSTNITTEGNKFSFTIKNVERNKLEFSHKIKIHFHDSNNNYEYSIKDNFPNYIQTNILKENKPDWIKPIIIGPSEPIIPWTPINPIIEPQYPKGMSKGILAGYIIGGIIIGLTAIGLVIYYIRKDNNNG